MTRPNAGQFIKASGGWSFPGLKLIVQVAGGALATAAVGLALIFAAPVHPGLWFAAVVLMGLPSLAICLDRIGTVPVMADGMALLSFTGLVVFLGLASGQVDSPFAAWLLIVPFAAAIKRQAGLLLWGLVLLAAGLGLFAVSGAGLFVQDLRTIWPSGTPLAVLGLAAITGAALAIAQLWRFNASLTSSHESEARYKMLVDGSPDLMLHFGGDGRIRFASSVTRDLFQTSPLELQGRSLSDFVSGEDRRAVQRALARTTYFGVESTLTFRLTGTDMRWVDMRCRPILRGEAKRNPLKWASKARDAAAFDTVAVLRDITDQMSQMGALEQARDDAHDANAAKSRFLANMSHELRTPLNAIIGFSDMMMSELFGPLGNPRYKEYVQHIKQGGEHLRDLINDVLDMSKIEAGRFDLEIEQVSIPKLIEDVLTTVSVTAGRKKIDLALDMGRDLPYLQADRRALKQMLLNLLANAIKFTPMGGQVATAARRDGSHIVFEVRDTGIGIPENDLSRLTQPFEQAARLGSAGETGTGLGLALVRALAELHDGSLAITSQEGHGTVVRITLPLQGPQTGRTPAAVPVIRMDQSPTREVA